MIERPSENQPVEDVQQARVALCRGLAASFRSVGDVLWVGGSIFGPDRAKGTTRFDFGSDGMVGLATITQVAGELMSGAINVLSVDNLYATMALARQLVEVEYLAWAFAEDREEAEGWMQSDKQERLKYWQPRHVRQRSDGRFRAGDYGQHCELGGHPAPNSTMLLPEHSVGLSAHVCWYELASHGVSIWTYIEGASIEFHVNDQVKQSASAGLADAISQWRAIDGPNVAAEFWASDP